MAAGGSVEVSVDSVDWLELTLEVLWPDGGFADEGYYGRVDPRPFRIHDLTPGRYLVRLSYDDITQQTEVQVAAGETTGVKFR